MKFRNPLSSSSRRLVSLACTLVLAAPLEALAQRRGRGNQRAAIELALNPAALEAIPKTTHPLVVRVQNISAAATSVRLSARAQRGVQVRFEQPNVLVTAYQTVDVRALVEVPDVTDYQPIVIGIQGSARGSRPVMVPLAIALIKPVEIVAALPAFDAGGNPLVALTLRNNLPSALLVTGSLRCTNGLSFAQPTQRPVRLRSRGVAKLLLEPAGAVDPVRQYEAEAQVSLTGAGTVKRKGHLNFTPGFYVGAPPLIDGDLIDWSDLGTLKLTDQWPMSGNAPWNGEADLSATIRFRWDKTHLYVGVEAVDNQHMQAGGQLAQGDSLSVAVVGGAGAGADMRLLTLALVGTETRTEGNGKQGAEVAAKKTETGVTYEAALPFATLRVGKVGDGKILPVALAVNDADATGRKSLQFFEGPAGENPHAFFGSVALTASTVFDAIEGEIIEGGEADGEAVEGETVEGDALDGEAVE